MLQRLERKISFVIDVMLLWGVEVQLRVLDSALSVGLLSRGDSVELAPLTRTLSHLLQLTKECLANIGIQPGGEAEGGEHGQKGIFVLVAAVPSTSAFRRVRQTGRHNAIFNGIRSHARSTI